MLISIRVPLRGIRENDRKNFTRKTSVRFIVFLQGTMNGNQKNTICGMSTTGFLTEFLLRIYNVQQAK